MKSMMKLFVFGLFILLMTPAKAKAEAPPIYGHVSFSYFYDRLAPYGEWIELDDGLMVWRPMHVRSDWSPYAFGGWEWTRYGWFWNSNEPYGDVVYHYGRWYNDDYYGWYWVPDYDWAPAWVQWRYDDDYIGWTPLPPYARFTIGGGISFTKVYVIHYNHWNFVPMRRFCDPYVSNYFVGERIKYRVYGHTAEHINYRYEDNVAANRGLDRDLIQRRTRTTVREREISFRDGTGTRNNGNRIEVGIPRTETKTRDIKDMTIVRGNRATSLETNQVTIGERRTTLEKPATRTDNRNERKIDNTPTRGTQPAIQNDNGRTRTPASTGNAKVEQQRQTPPQQSNGQGSRISNEQNNRTNAPADRRQQQVITEKKAERTTITDTRSAPKQERPAIQENRSAPKQERSSQPARESKPQSDRDKKETRQR